MLRALSTRTGRRGYQRLVADESFVSSTTDRRRGHQRLVADECAAISLLDGNLKRSKTLPARSFDLSAKLASPHHIKVKPAPKKLSKIAAHPLFALFDTRRKNKTTAKPELARYLQYMREGGTWDVNSNMPVIFYK
ncbi:uncharacterized protein LOC130015440 [Mercurialis annua]|uniref:uncharacterized protein LOC130015440 n=1 Tax=Mercurialis annua TaxID=3986 RepID=UPI0024AED851|nr:uncharacterized protein LOC130015440 [Mercurialis annua]